MHRVLAIAVAACMWTCLPSVCLANQTARLDVKLTPERLGAGTTVVFGFQIAAPGGEVPSPLTEIDLRYPANLGIATSGLGIENCQPAILQAQGPKGCPANSQMGYGSALIEVPFGPEIIRETATTRMFSAPVDNDRIALLIYTEGTTPIVAQLLFPAVLAPVSPPFGGSLNTDLPLVPTLPAAPDVAVVRFNSTIGPQRLTYHKQVHGKVVDYTPKGIKLPKSCPHGGFPFAADFSFADGARANSVTHVPCPRGH